MKGAMAEPFANTMRAPTMSITSMTGISQYFLRARMNAHNSTISDTAVWLP